MWLRKLLGRAAPVGDYVSEAAEAMHRLADVGELIADGLFAIAAGMHTKELGTQRNMAAVFAEDARTRYGDVLNKLNKEQRTQLQGFIDGVCSGKRSK
jgi:hypothetical protein